MNQLIQVTTPDGDVQKRFVYDLQGNLIKEIDAKVYVLGDTDESRIGNLYTYNIIGWCIEKRRPIQEMRGEIDYEVTQYKYDEVGNLIEERRYLDVQTETSSNGRVHKISYVYDKANRLIQVSDCIGAVIEYGYDSLNQKTYERNKINDTTYQISNYKYDGNGNLLELSQSADKLGMGKRFSTTRYRYNASGNLIEVTMPKGYKIHRMYDLSNRMIRKTHVDSVGEIYNRFDLTYDKAGNMIALTDSLEYKVTDHYDTMNHMIKQIDQVGAVSRNFYNKNGWLNRFIIKNFHHAHELVFEYIDAFYNTQRIHSHCDYKSPYDFEEQIYICLVQLYTSTLL